MGHAASDGNGRGNGRGTFDSLHSRNYRLYFTGQLISMAGTFMQTVAQAWLVLKLSGSSLAVGLVVAMQCLPMLLLGPLAGVLVDRTDRRRLWMITQSIAGTCALVLGLVTVTGVVRLWMVFAFALMLGTVMTLDQTTKISLIPDLVDHESVANAVSLNQALNQMAKIVGPSLGGVLIAVVGIGPCFLFNACSFVGVIIGLALMRPEEMHREPLQTRAPRQVRDGLAFVRRTPELLSLLLMAGVFFGFVYAFDVVLPGLAKYTFHGGPGLFGLMMSTLAGGSFIGALGVARRANPSAAVLNFSGMVTGVFMLLAAMAPTLPILLPLLAVVGVSATTFQTTCSARLMTHTPAAVRGRITALYMVAAIGTRPIGSPLVGFIGQHGGPRFALAAGGLAILFVALPVRWLVMAVATPDRAALGRSAADLMLRPEMEAAVEA